MSELVQLRPGGTVSGIEGRDDTLKPGNVVCGNEYVHAELVKILKPLGKRRRADWGACA
jgi:myo-inositol-1(or 4)-monophosphatase